MNVTKAIISVPVWGTRMLPKLIELASVEGWLHANNVVLGRL